MTRYRENQLVGMLSACYADDMANLQVKDIPEDLHRRLRDCAQERGTTISEVVLGAVRRELDYAHFSRRLSQRYPVDLGGPASEFVAAERHERGQDD